MVEEGSVHTSAWPRREELDGLLAGDSVERVETDQRIDEWATAVLFEVRKQRSEAKQPMRVAITKVRIKVPDGSVSLLMPHVEADLKAALRVKAFETIEGEPREFVVAGYEP